MLWRYRRSVQKGTSLLPPGPSGLLRSWRYRRSVQKGTFLLPPGSSSLLRSWRHRRSVQRGWRHLPRGRTGGGVKYPTQSEHILINTRVDRSLEIYLDDRTYQVEERGDEALSDRRTTRQRHPPCDTSQPARSSCS